MADSGFGKISFYYVNSFQLITIFSEIEGRSKIAGNHSLSKI